MRQIKFLAFLLFFSFIATAQFPNNLIKKYKIRKVIGLFFPDGAATDSSTIIDIYSTKGLIISHEQIDDTSKFAKQTYTYQLDYLGRVKNKVSFFANGEINEVSLYYYYDEKNVRFKNNETKEYRVTLLNNNIDTIIYDQNDLALSKGTALDLTTYLYNDKQDLIGIKYMLRRNGDVSDMKFLLKYDSSGLLTEGVSEAMEFFFEYDVRGRPIKSISYEKSVGKIQANFYYND